MYFSIHALVCCLCALDPAAVAQVPATVAPPASTEWGVNVADASGVPPQPALFVENLGQWPDYIRFVSGGGGTLVRAECGAIALDLPQGGNGDHLLVRIRFLGTSDSAGLVGTGENPALFHYFVGNDRSKWHSNAHAFREVRYCDLYPGIDLVLHATSEGAKYDLVVAPGADPSLVHMRIEGLPEIDLPEDGSMTALSKAGFLLHMPGRCYERIDQAGLSVEHDLECSWKAMEPFVYRLEVKRWDPINTLVIDPDLLWSTYLGSTSGTQCKSVAFTPTGDVVVTGRTSGNDFPQTAGSYQHQQNVIEQCFVTKFRGSDGTLLFSSVFGGTESANSPTALAIDGLSGDIALTGNTSASDFPVTGGAYDSVKTCPQGIPCGFATKLSADGSQLLASTYLEGPSSGSYLLAISIIPGGAMLLGGAALNDYPTTPGAFQPVAPSITNAVLSKLSSDGSQLVWSTFLSGSASQGVYDVKPDAQGNVVVVGSTNSSDFPTTPGAYKTVLGVPHSNLFITRLSADGSQVLVSTFLGGMNTVGEFDEPTGFGFDCQGNVLIGGRTNNGGYPVTLGAWLTQFPFGGGGTVGIISKLDVSLSTLLASTFVGQTPGLGPTSVESIVVNASGMPTVRSGGLCGFYTTPGAFDTACMSVGPGKNVIMRFTPGLDRVIYSTFMGGPYSDPIFRLGENPGGTIACTGYCESPGGWPITPNAFQPNYPGGGRAGFVTVFDLLLQGLSLSGTSVPSCLGPLSINGTRMPSAGSTHFSVYCSSAPPNSLGWLFLGTPGPGLGHIGGGVSLHHVYQILRVQSDGLGYVETPVSLASQPAGAQLTAQYVFRNPPNCQGPGSTSSSPQLTISVQ